jgi:hypothetical protein
MTPIQTNDPIEVPTEKATEADDGAASEPEFVITVRKLQVPARPRGVLAE